MGGFSSYLPPLFFFFLDIYINYCSFTDNEKKKNSISKVPITLYTNGANIYRDNVTYNVEIINNEVNQMVEKLTKEWYTKIIRIDYETDQAIKKFAVNIGVKPGTAIRLILMGWKDNE